MLLRAYRPYVLRAFALARRMSSSSPLPLGISSVGLHVADVAAALPFYADACALRLQAGLRAEGRYRLGSVGEPGLLLLPAPPSPPPGAQQATALPALPRLTVAVSNLKTAARHARRHGGSTSECRAGASNR